MVYREISFSPNMQSKSTKLGTLVQCRSHKTETNLPNKDHNGLNFATLYAKEEGVKIPHIKRRRVKGAVHPGMKEGRQASEQVCG